MRLNAAPLAIIVISVKEVTEPDVALTRNVPTGRLVDGSVTAELHVPPV